MSPRETTAWEADLVATWQGRARALGLAWEAEGGGGLPASGLQRAGPGRGRGTGHGGRRVSTCLQVARERETAGARGGRRNTKEPRCTLGAMHSFHYLQDRFYYFKHGCMPEKTVVPAPCSSDPILDTCHSCPPPSCSEARAGVAGPPIMFVNFYYVTSSQSEWLIRMR